jgi:glycosyltransferase involved in cell wall biosynthesis
MLSICIPAYHCNVDALLRALQIQLESVSGEAEIVVCDDNSPAPILTNPSEFPGLRVLRNSKNLGRARTRNLLVQAAQGQAILFLDGDSEVISSNFISSWIEIAQNPSIFVSYGGSIYQAAPPPSSHFLRWKVSTLRESKTSEERNRNMGGFKTNNVLIRRSVFEKVTFNEQLTGYGHEDTLFGFELHMNGYKTHHLDNPVRNAVLDSNEIFLAKTEEAIRNLSKCVEFASDPEAFIAHVRLLRVYAKLKKYYLLVLLRLTAYVCLPLLYKRLKSGRSFAIVFAFDCFKFFQLNRILGVQHHKP